MSYYRNDCNFATKYYNTDIREKVRRFDNWWKMNELKLQKKNLHSFSGLTINSMIECRKKEYYYKIWNIDQLPKCPNAS